jgi:hypothetical protein
MCLTNALGIFEQKTAVKIRGHVKEEELWRMRKHKEIKGHTTGGMYVVCLNSSVNGTRKHTKQKIQTN